MVRRSINALMDVSCYTQGASTTLVRQLIVACVAALVDTAWTAAGFVAVVGERGGIGERNTLRDFSG
jgi:hypothetical protein